MKSKNLRRRRTKAKNVAKKSADSWRKGSKTGTHGSLRHKP